MLLSVATMVSMATVGLAAVAIDSSLTSVARGNIAAVTLAAIAAS